MDKYFKNKTNRIYDHWKFTHDGKYPKCNPKRKYRKMRRRNQRAIEKEHLNKRLKDDLG